MWWKRLLGNGWAFILGNAVQAPGWLDDFAFWQRVFGDMSAGLQGALIAGGILITSLSALTLIERHWAYIRAHAKDIAGVALVVLVLGLIGGIGYGISLIDFSRPEKAWVHENNLDPTKTLADCKMRAYDALGGKWQQEGERADYLAACMEREEFKWTVIEEGGGG